MAGFFFSGDEIQTPKSIESKRKLIEMLSRDAYSSAPVQHWTQGLARVMTGAANGYEEAGLRKAETAGRNDWIAKALGELGGSPDVGSGPISPSISSQPPAVSAQPPAPASNAVETNPLPPPMAAADVPLSNRQTMAGASPVIPSGSFAPQAGSVSQRSPELIRALGNGQPVNVPPGAPPGTPQVAMNPGGTINSQPINVPQGAPNAQPSEQELVARTIAAETGGKSQQEANAIAAVILNRAKSRQLSPADVVLERNQFEPWNGGPGARNDPMAIDMNSPRGQQAMAALQAAQAGQDPTGGATHFVGTAAQAALGRPMPAWSNKGDMRQRIGATTFYAPEGRVTGGAPVQVAQSAQPAGQPAQNDAPSPDAAQAQFNVPGAQAGARRPPNTAALLRLLSDPWAAENPALMGVAQKVLGEQLSGNKLTYQTDGDGNIIALDPTGRQQPRVVYQAAIKPMTIAEGARLVNPKTGQEIASGGDKGTPDQKNYEAAVKGGFKGSFSDYQIALRRAASAQPESTFNVEMSKGQAKQFTEMASEYAGAKSDIAGVKMLREQLGKLPGGFMGNAQAMAVRMGVKIGENASAVEAADAILNRLTPAQRQGMPGAASDRDVAMFRGALPSLGQTKEGQKLIMDTMEGLATYKLRQAEIAQQVAMGKMKPEQAMEALAAIPDPFEQFKAVQGAQGSQPSSPATGKARVISRDQYQSLPSGSQFIAADDPTQTVRTKP